MKQKTGSLGGHPIDENYTSSAVISRGVAPTLVSFCFFLPLLPFRSKSP